MIEYDIEERRSIYQYDVENKEELNEIRSSTPIKGINRLNAIISPSRIKSIGKLGPIK